MKSTYLVLLLLFPFSIYAQSVSSSEPDARVIEAYGETYINRLKTENPFLIKRWNFYLDNAFMIVDDVPGKKANYKTVIIDDLENFNILAIEKEQQLERAWGVPTIYKIKDTNKLLVYHSGKEFNEKLSAHLKQ